MEEKVQGTPEGNNDLGQEQTVNQTNTEQDVPSVQAQSQEEMIQDMVAANPSLMNDPQIKSFIENKNNKGSQPKATNEAKGSEQTQAKTESRKDSNKETKKSEETKQEDEASIFYNKMVEEKQQNIKSFEEAIEAVNKKYSIDPNKDGGWDTFLGSVDKWRTDAQKKSDLEKQLEGIQEAFDNMPEPLYNAMEAWSMGNDFQEAYNSSTVSKIDFKKDFNSQDLHTVVDHYFPSQFEKDDLEDVSDPTVKRAIDLAERQYKIDKDNNRHMRAKQEQQERERVESFKKSVNSSVENLKKTFPAFSDSHFKQIEKVLKSGDIDSLFFNNDSTYKADAAEKIAFMLYGKDELLRVRNSTAKKSKSETLEEVVSRGADKPNVSGNQNAVKTNSQTDVSKMFEGLVDKRHY